MDVHAERNVVTWNDPRIQQLTSKRSKSSSNEFPVNNHLGSVALPPQYKYMPQQQQQYQNVAINQPPPSGYQYSQQSHRSNTFSHQQQQEQLQYYQNHQQLPSPQFQGQHRSFDLKKAGKGLLKQLKSSKAKLSKRSSQQQYPPEGVRPPVDQSTRDVYNNNVNHPYGFYGPAIGQKPPFNVQLVDPPMQQSHSQVQLQQQQIQQNEPSPDIKIGVLPKKKESTNQYTSNYQYQQSQIYYPPPPPIEYPPPPTEYPPPPTEYLPTPTEYPPPPTEYPPPPTEYPAYPPDVSPKISNSMASPSPSTIVHESPKQLMYSLSHTNYPQQSKENDYDSQNLTPIIKSSQQLTPPSDSKPIDHSPQSQSSSQQSEQLKYPPPNYLPPDQNQSPTSISQSVVQPQNLVSKTSHELQIKYPPNYLPPHQNQPPQSDLSTSYRHDYSSPQSQQAKSQVQSQQVQSQGPQLRDAQSQQAQSRQPPPQQQYDSQNSTESFSQARYEASHTGPINASVGSSNEELTSLHLKNKTEEAPDTEISQDKSIDTSVGSPNVQSNPLHLNSKAEEAPNTEFPQNKYPPSDYPPQYYSQSAELSQSGSYEASVQQNYHQPLDQQKSKSLHPIQFFPPATISSIPTQNSDKPYPTPPSDVNPKPSSSFISENDQAMTTTHSQNQTQKYSPTSSFSERQSIYNQSSFSSPPDQKRVSVSSNQPSQYIVPILSEQTQIQTQKTPPVHHSPNYPPPPSYQGHYQYTNYLPSTEQKNQFSNPLQWKPPFDPLVQTSGAVVSSSTNTMATTVQSNSSNIKTQEHVSQQEIEDSINQLMKNSTISPQENISQQPDDITELMKTIELGSPKPSEDQQQNLLLQKPFSQKPTEQQQQSQYPHQAPPQVYHYQPPQQQSQYYQQQQYLQARFSSTIPGAASNVVRPGITLHDPGFLSRPGGGVSVPTNTSQHQQPYLQQQNSQHMQNQKQYY
ncbi:1238_t:CDS:10 [Ambispora leptoticha]|uniref:1238_t:CDS:1 n=1 Tax=Ambispora leptoticha TaxID=144679 RepID=A0A9N9BZN9_9GLOM|nr:1238_t:CDS:10 [Ambispora leptoticha]